MTDDLRDTGELELRDYLAVLRRRKVTIIATVVLVVVASIAYSLLQTPQYRGTAEVLLQRQSTQDIVAGVVEQTNAQNETQRVQTEIEVMRSRSVEDAVRDELGYVPNVSVSAKGETSVVTVSATDTDPERAAEEANTYASTFITSRRDANVAELERAVEVLNGQVQELDRQVEEADQRVAAAEEQLAGVPEDDPSFGTLVAARDQAVADRDDLTASLQTQRSGLTERLGQLQLSLNAARVDGGGRVVSFADVPESPFAPDPIRNGALAVVLGLLLGAGIAFLRDYLDDRVRTKDDLDLATGGVDVLGLVPRVEGWKDRTTPQLVSVTDPNSPAAEAYRGLRTSLQFIGVDRRLRIVQVTSSSQAEGKTTTICNLAVALARAGQRVVLVDCDLRRPRVHQFFGLENRYGFTSAILGDHEVADVIQAVPGVPRLAVLPAGPIPPNPSELLATRRTGGMLESLTEHADFVLVDCPPLLPVADAVVVASYVDATLLVTTANLTTKRSLGRALEMLRQVDAPLVGTVLNGLEEEAAYAYSYGEGGYAADYTTRQAGRSRFGRRRYGPSASPGDAAAAPLPGEDGPEVWQDDDWDGKRASGED